MARTHWCWALTIVSSALWLADGRAATAAPADEPEETPKLECLHRHEDSQLERRQGKLLAARTALLACSRADCPAAVRADCVDWLEEVNHSIPSVVITARDRGIDVAEVKVFLDGELVAARLTGGALEADPGQHRFRFESAGGPVVERGVLMSEGVRNRPVDVEFAPPPPSPSSPPSPSPSPTLAAENPPSWSLASHPIRRSDALFAGVAIAGLGTAALLGGLALHERAALEQSCAPFCNDADLDPVRTKLLIADVALATSLAALAIGAVRYLRRPAHVAATHSAGADFRLVVGASRGGGRLLIGRAF